MISDSGQRTKATEHNNIKKLLHLIAKNPLKAKLASIIFKASARTAQQTHHLCYKNQYFYAV